MSNYIQKILGKSIEKIQLDHVKEFFKSPQEETSILEFKSGEVDILKVFKEIAAFHNTEGGLLIVGAPKEQVQEIGKVKKKLCQGNLTYSKFEGRDWLLQKIGSNIVPYPTGIQIKDFQTEQGAVFLIDVPQSTNPPHQCTSDGCYYIRIDNESKPAPHGFIQAMFNQRRKPKLLALINFKASDQPLRRSVTINIHNNSKIPAEQTTFLIQIYNASSIAAADEFRSDKDDDTGLLRHYFTKSTDGILPSLVNIQYFLEVTTVKAHLLFCVSMWAKDCDIVTDYYTYNAKTEEVRLLNREDEIPSMFDMVDGFHKMLKEIGDDSLIKVSPNKPKP